MILSTLFTSCQNKRQAKKAFNPHSPIDQRAFPHLTPQMIFGVGSKNGHSPPLPPTPKSSWFKGRDLTYCKTIGAVGTRRDSGKPLSACACPMATGHVRHCSVSITCIRRLGER